jgi:hypothetical protein
MSSRYEKVVSKGVKDKKSHQAKANEREAKSSKLQRKLVEPQLLDAPRYIQQKGKKEVYPQAANEIADWVRTSEKDTRLDMLKKIQTDTKGNTEYGKLMANPDMIIDAYTEKKNQEANWRLTKLGALLINERRPETQARAYEIMPDLKNYPEEYHLRNIEIQETIRTWFRDGQISGMDDLILLDHVIRDEFIIEMGPLWDPKGLIIDSVVTGGKFLDGLPTFIQRGLWNPRRHASANAKKDSMQELQRGVKAMLLKRVLPGFEDWKLEDIQRWMIEHRISPVTNKDTTDSGKWFPEIRDDTTGAFYDKTNAWIAKAVPGV